MKNHELAPICLFTYNRLEETKKTVQALHLNNLAGSSELFVFSDGWRNNEAKKKVELVRTFLKTISGFKKVTIIESEINKGLAKSIIDGVSNMLNRYSRVIVLEDDLRTTPNFLDFMNQSLDFYENNRAIQSVSGYSLKIRSKMVDSDVYFHHRAHSWSWATWSNRWDDGIFDKQRLKNELTKEALSSFKETCGADISEMLVNSINGVNDSWYVRWAYSHFKNNTYGVYPNYSKVENIGFTNEGTNCNGIDVSLIELDKFYKKKFKFIDIVTIDKNINREFLIYFTKFYKFKYRLKLLKSLEGRKSLFFEISRKFRK